MPWGGDVDDLILLWCWRCPVSRLSGSIVEPGITIVVPRVTRGTRETIIVPRVTRLTIVVPGVTITTIEPRVTRLTIVVPITTIVLTVMTAVVDTVAVTSVPARPLPAPHLVLLHQVHHEGVELAGGQQAAVHLQPDHVPRLEDGQTGGGAATARPGRAAGQLRPRASRGERGHTWRGLRSGEEREGDLTWSAGVEVEP